MKDTQPSFTIGKLADIAGVNIETIRYYQRKGLIKEPARPAQGYRKYSQSVVETIRFIKRAQQLGFSLREISELLKLGNGHCADVREHAEIKLKKVEQQIRDLETLKNTLRKLIQQCRQGKSQHCPIVKSLLSDSSSTPDHR